MTGLTGLDGKKIADGLNSNRRRDRRQRARPRYPARIGNLRNCDWQSLGINFVLVFSPNAFKGGAAYPYCGR